MLRGSTSSRIDPTGTASVGTSVTRMRRFSITHCPMKQSPIESRSDTDLGCVRVAREQLVVRLVRHPLIDHALVRADQRHQLRQEQLADRHQIALPLQHSVNRRDWSQHLLYCARSSGASS